MTLYGFYSFYIPRPIRRIQGMVRRTHTQRPSLDVPLFEMDGNSLSISCKYSTPQIARYCNWIVCVCVCVFVCVCVCVCVFVYSKMV